MTDYCDFY